MSLLTPINILYKLGNTLVNPLCGDNMENVNTSEWSYLHLTNTLEIWFGMTSRSFENTVFLTSLVKFIPSYHSSVRLIITLPCHCMLRIHNTISLCSINSLGFDLLKPTAHFFSIFFSNSGKRTRPNFQFTGTVHAIAPKKTIINLRHSWKTDIVETPLARF